VKFDSTIDSELRLQRSEEKFNMLFEYSPVGMALVDHETGQFIEANRSLLHSTGYTKDEFLNLTYWDITPREYEEQEMQQIVDLNEKGVFGPNEKEYIRKDGTRYPIRIRGFILKDVDDRKIVWGIIEDISELKQLEEELRLQAMRDHLTGAYNRRFFMETLNQILKQARRTNNDLAVIIFDIDHFKEINDEFGHGRGDEILIEITKVVQKSIRDSDVLCRWGGEEFMILLPATSLTNGVFVAEKIRANINQAELNLPRRLSCSFGVTASKTEDAETIINRVDSLMYKAKQNGRNRVEYV